MERGRSSGSSKGSLILRPFTGCSWPKTMVRSMNSIGRQYPLVPGTIFHRGHDCNTIRDTSIRWRSSIKASDGTSNRQGTSAAMRSCRHYWRHTCSRLTASGRKDMAAHKETSMFTIDVRFTIQEAVALMRAIAAKGGPKRILKSAMIWNCYGSDFMKRFIAARP